VSSHNEESPLSPFEKQVLENVYKRVRALRLRRHVLQGIGAAVGVFLLGGIAFGMVPVLRSSPKQTIHTIGEPPPSAQPSPKLESPSPATTKVGPIPSNTPLPSVSPNHIFCTPAEVEVIAATDRSSYQPSDLVIVSTSITNRSPHPCELPASLSVDLKDSTGKSVDVSHPVLHYDSGGGSQWKPGTTRSDKIGFQLETRSGPVPPGEYLATVTWQIGGNATASVVVRVESQSSASPSPSSTATSS
jgi:hypothetical protein